MQKYSFGAIPSPPDPRDYVLATTSKPLPTEYILPPVAVKNQGNVGACVAFAVTSSKENEMAGEHGKGYTRLSEGFLYANSKGVSGFYTGVGSFPRQILKQMQKYGTPTYDQYPKYGEKPGFLETVANDINAEPELLEKANQNRIGRYYRIGLTVDAIKNAIYETKAPVVFTWTIRGRGLVTCDGFLTPRIGNLISRHAMILYGWDDNQEVLYGQNSWGEYWGNNGRFKLKYEDAVPDNGTREGLKEAWAIDTEMPPNELKMKIGSKEYFLNGERKEMDVACYLDENDRTMVPIRFVSEAMGATVSWHPYYTGYPKQLMRIMRKMSYVQINDIKHSSTIRFYIDKDVYSRRIENDDNYGFEMDTTAVLDEAAGRVFVPVRYVVNALQGLVEWNEKYPKDIVIRF